MVYVDALFTWPVDCTENAQARAHAEKNRGRWSHMWADTPDELHEFAARIGLKRAWAQHEGQPNLHYDLTPGKRWVAVKAGAIEATTLDWLEARKRTPEAPSLDDLF